MFKKLIWYSNLIGNWNSNPFSSRFNPDIHNEDDFLDWERWFTGNPFSNIHPKCTKDHDLIKVKFGNTVFNHVDDDNKQCSVFEHSK